MSGRAAASRVILNYRGVGGHVSGFNAIVRPRWPHGTEDFQERHRLRRGRGLRCRRGFASCYTSAAWRRAKSSIRGLTRAAGTPATMASTSLS